MLTAFRVKPMKGFLLKPISQRHASGAVAIKDRFHQAWLESSKSFKVEQKEAQNKKEYGSGYYQRHHQRIKKGYTHPYHSQEHPLNFSSVAHGWNIMSDLVGPEQVSPHYESLSRSRRGLIFLFFYIGTITSVARLGGWDHNEWIRGLVFHHEYLIALYVGYAEIRHFTWLPGPKFSVFYEVFSRYEAMQLANQWNDTAEELSTQFYNFTRSQVDYMRLHKEYKYIKKRALVNYLTNEKLNLEKHFHDRTLSMLNQITSFEQQNMKNKLNSITQEAFKATLDRFENDKGELREKAFQSALDGIRKGKMDFSQDPILPIMQEELRQRTQELKDLSEEEESRLLSLTSDQRKAVAQMDRAAKDTYLSTAPHVSSQGLKSHEKFNKFVNYVTNAGRKDVV